MNHMRMSAVASCVLLLASTGVLAAEKKKQSKPAPPDSSTTIPGGAEGKTMDSITIEGEDRVRVQFDRPPLNVDLDPASAQGLDWDSTWMVLAPDAFDFREALLAHSAYERATYAPRPWLDEFRTGAVTRFRPQVTGVEAWKLEVADSRGNAVATFAGTGKMPKEIQWDGRTKDGSSARADLTYSYVVHATDKAGNKRSFLGDSFQIPPHMNENKGEVELSFSVPANPDTELPGPIVLEVASRLNQRGDETRAIRVDVTAPTVGIAQAVADQVVSLLRANLVGEPSRIAAFAHADAGGSELAAVVVRSGGAPSASAPKPAVKTPVKK